MRGVEGVRGVAGRGGPIGPAGEIGDPGPQGPFGTLVLLEIQVIVVNEGSVVNEEKRVRKVILQMFKCTGCSSTNSTSVTIW